MNEIEPDGIDGTWLVTHGAHMAWRYARSVQSAMADLEAALDNRNWRLCVESCVVALRAIAFCHHVGAGISGPPTEIELHLRLATDPSAPARALRALPWPANVGEAEAREAAATVRRHDAQLRQALPFELPIIRAASEYGPSVRITTTIGRWRARRGMGPVGWNREGL